MSIRGLGGRASGMAGIAAVCTITACATMWPTFTGRAAMSRGDAYHCAFEQVKSLGFTPETFNADNGAIDAQRLDKEASRELAGEQQKIDRLSIHASRNGDAGATLTVQPQTVIRRYSRTGWVFDQETASPLAVQSAHAVLKACAPAT